MKLSCLICLINLHCSESRSFSRSQFDDADERMKYSEENEKEPRLRVSSRGDEIETAVHSGIWDALLSGDIHLLSEELLILLIDVLANGLPAADANERVKLSRLKQKNVEDQTGSQPVQEVETHSPVVIID